MATCGNGAVIGMPSIRPRIALIIKAPQMGQSVSSVVVLGTRFRGGAVLPIGRLPIPKKAGKTWGSVSVSAKDENDKRQVVRRRVFLKK